MAIIKPLMQKLWASGGAIVKPSDSKIETGWVSEVPPHQWENWIQNRQDQFLGHINERGIPEWDGNTEYLASGKSYVQGSNGTIYKSVASSGPATVAQDPTTDATSTYWTSEIATVASETRYGSTKLATQAEVNSGTSGSLSVTPSKLRFGFSISLASTGYIALPSWMGGLIIQWGSINPAATIGNPAAVTFPITFPNMLFTIVTTVGQAPTTTTSASWWSNGTNTGFDVRSNQTSSGVRWIAIGN